MSVTVAQKPCPKRRSNRNGGNGGGAPISTAVSLSPKNSNSVKLHGTDRLIHVPDISRYDAGHVVVDLSMSCASFHRLSHMSEAYQRVRFKKLVFRVVTMCSTYVSGGYACAFVADPTDVLGDGSNALDRVVAQTGSKITKVWESATVAARLTPDLLYTSDPPQGDKRLSSPGRLWLIVESKCSNEVPLTVYCDWAVEMAVPSLEAQTGQAGALVVTENFFARKSNVGLWYQPKGKSPIDDPRKAIPGIEFDVLYKSKQKYFVSFTQERGGNFDQFKMVNDQTHGITLAPVGLDNKTIIDTAEGDYWMLERGDFLTPIPNLSGVGLEFLCRQTALDSKPSRMHSDSSLGFSDLTRPLASLPKPIERDSSGLSKPSRMQPFSEKGPTLRSSLEKQMESLLRLADRSRSPSFEILSEDGL